MLKTFKQHRILSKTPSTNKQTNKQTNKTEWHDGIRHFQEKQQNDFCSSDSNFKPVLKQSKLSTFLQLFCGKWLKFKISILTVISKYTKSYSKFIWHQWIKFDHTFLDCLLFQFCATILPSNINNQCNVV